MSGKRKRSNVSGPGSAASSRSGSPLQSPTNDKISIGTSTPWPALTSFSSASSSDVFDPMAVAEPVPAKLFMPLTLAEPADFAEHFPTLVAYATTIHDQTFAASPSAHMSLVSSRLQSALPDMKKEVDQLLADTRLNLDKIIYEKNRFEEWAKLQLGFNVSAKVDGDKFSRRRSSVELLIPSGSVDKVSSASTLKIKKTETGEFKITSLLLSPTKQDDATTRPSEEPKVRVNESYKSSRRGTGSKNLSRMQSKTSKAAHSVSTDGVFSPASAASSSSVKDKKDQTKPSSSGPTGSTKSTSTAAKPVVPNQTSINVFWNYVDQYFRPIHDEDLKWLQSTSSIEANADFFIIPPLGASLKREDATAMDSLESRKGPMSNPMGLLTSRLLASLIEVKAISSSSSFKEEDMGSNEDTNSPIRKSSDDSVVPASIMDARKRWVDVEDRIRRDLSFLGIMTPEYVEESFENDEVCGQLRQLQTQLRLQCSLNDYRKRKLCSILLNRLASQEYYHVLEDIDKQVEYVYFKKYMNASSGSTASKKKKKASNMTPLSTPSNSVSGEGGMSAGSTTPMLAEEINYSCVEKRKLLLESFGEVIPSREKLQQEANETKLFLTDEEIAWSDEQIQSLPFPPLAPSSSSLGEKSGQSMRALAASLIAQPVGATLAIDTDEIYTPPTTKKKKTLSSKKLAHSMSIK